MTESKENLTDSCERSTEYYIDINDSTAFGRGSDELFSGELGLHPHQQLHIELIDEGVRPVRQCAFIQFPT